MNIILSQFRRAVVLAIFAISGHGARGAELPVPGAECVRATVDAALEELAGAGVGQESALLQEFYRERAFQPAWNSPGRSQSTIRDLIAAIENAGAQGLDPADYRLAGLRQCDNPVTIDHLARQDVLLSDALLRYTRDLRSGVTAFNAADPKWHWPEPKFDPVAFVHELSLSPFVTKTLDQTLGRLEPPFAGYSRLKTALNELQKTPAANTPQLPAGPILKPGERHPQIVALKNRLMAEGFHFAATTQQVNEQVDADVLDDELVQALKTVQVRYGLAADGALGPATREALNMTRAERLDKIKLNLDRWRWLPHDPGERYLLVNLAAFRLTLVEHGKAVFASNVIVGRTYRSTPAFAGEMTYLQFNPYWNVPPNLARRDLVPKQIEESNYLAGKGFKILGDWSTEPKFMDPAQIDWEALAGRRLPFRLRQDPGPQNALGRVKFMFPNSFNVYLHDTPEKELFHETSRTFSSGCIRVEKPLELAKRILAPEGWSGSEVENAFNSSRTQSVGLEKSVPVYVGYWTAWVDEDGELRYAPDVYGRDRAVLEARLKQAGPEQARTKQAGPAPVALAAD